MLVIQLILQKGKAIIRKLVIVKQINTAVFTFISSFVKTEVGKIGIWLKLKEDVVKIV